MKPNHHLLVAMMLAALGLVPRMGAAQDARAQRALYLTTDPTRVTCLLPEELEGGDTTDRCHVMECDSNGDHCGCPLQLPNGWKQPLSEGQCQQLGQLLRPLPSVDPTAASGKARPKTASVEKQVAEKDKTDERKLYVVRFQAQGNNVGESVVLAGLEALKGKLPPRERQLRTEPFQRAERFLRDMRAAGGIHAVVKRSFSLHGSNIRVDVEILRGLNFSE